jgi:hypothetical protein
MTPQDTAHIATKEDLVAVLDHMRSDCLQNRQTWENQDILSFLEAFQAWLGSSKNYYKNQQIDMASVTPWKEIADALAAARIYE